MYIRKVAGPRVSLSFYILKLGAHRHFFGYWLKGELIHECPTSMRFLYGYTIYIYIY